MLIIKKNVNTNENSQFRSGEILIIYERNQDKISFVHLQISCFIGLDGLYYKKLNRYSRNLTIIMFVDNMMFIVKQRSTEGAYSKTIDFSSCLSLNHQFGRFGEKKEG